MDNVKEKILQLLKQKGPVIPVQISKEIETNILMASAYLSELSSNNLVKVSNLKIGGSPLYYLPGHEYKLQDFASKLHEKEKKSYELLKEKKILQDSVLDPILRVTLRNIKDFAIPLKVDHKGYSDIFWKWYLLSNKDAEVIIKSQLKWKEDDKITKQVKEPIKKETIKSEETQTTIKKESKIQHVKKEKALTEDFFYDTQQYFNRNKINILEQKIIRKNKDMEMIVEIPSHVGNLKYFCKAKNKKKINDGDLSSIYIQAQSKRLPVLFITTGELTKKAKEMLETEFKGLKVKKI